MRKSGKGWEITEEDGGKNLRFLENCKNWNLKRKYFFLFQKIHEVFVKEFVFFKHIFCMEVYVPLIIIQSSEVWRASIGG